MLHQRSAVAKDDQRPYRSEAWHDRGHQGIDPGLVQKGLDIGAVGVPEACLYEGLPSHSLERAYAPEGFLGSLRHHA